MRPRAWLLAILSMALSPASLSAAATENPGVDRIIVKWRDTANAARMTGQAQLRTLARRAGTPLQRGRHLGGSLSVLELPGEQRGAELAATLAALRADPAVEIAAPDRRMRILATPSDPMFSAPFVHNSVAYDQQWYLKGAHPAAIRASAAWDLTRGGTTPAGSPVVIAVVDTGIRPDHEDLAAKLLPGFDFVSDIRVANDGDGWDPDPSDPGDFITLQDMQNAPFKGNECGSGENHDEELPSTWHGTRVAGLIGASTDNGIGIAGAGFNVRILPVRVLGKCGGNQSDVLAGMYWAAGFFDAGSHLPIPAPLLTDPAALRDHPNLHPAQIINLSLGAAYHCDPFYSIAVREITAVGVLIVAAAGNDGGEVDEPASCPGALAVAGLRHTGTKVGYSNLGPEVGIAAPAGNCIFLRPQPCVFALNTTTDVGTQAPVGDGYSTPAVQASFGTSFSAPLVAATAGLMKAVNPALTPALLGARIKESARPFPASDDITTQVCVVPATPPEEPLSCVCTKQVCGAGMLDANRAVQAALRPAVLISATRSGGTFTLDGSHSAAADGRSIASHSWQVLTVTGGASVPLITNAGEPIASIPVPARGKVTLQLEVTDTMGSSDSAHVTIGTGGSASEFPPPASGVDRGGGSPDGMLLALLCLLLASRLAHRRAPAGSRTL